MDRQIEVRVSGNHLWKDSNLAGVQGEGNVTTLRITFDEGWSGYAKSVTFFNAKGKNPVKCNLTADLLEDIAQSTLVYLCKVLPEPLTEAGRCSFVIEGFENDKRQRVVQTELDVLRADETTGAARTADPTPTQAEQLQAQIENIIGDMQEQAIIASDAANNAKTSEDNAKASEEAAERAQQAVEGMTVTGKIVDPHSNLPAVERTVENGVVHLNLNIRRGFPGVYVGSGQMPDGYNVQVDPNGTGMDVSAIIEAALQEAKDSGEFDGPAGKDGQIGPTGKDGQTGPAGKDGYSPTVSVSAISGGHRVTITDAKGTRFFDVLNGKDGGGGGGSGVAGEDGVTFYPHLDENGNLSWTNDGGLTNPDPVNIMGPQGNAGKDGQPGTAGKDGNPGADGVSPTVSVAAITGGHRIAITDKNGTKTVDVMDGSDGAPGQPGATGADGQPGAAGKDATINGVNALTIGGNGGVAANQSGSQLNLSVAGTFGGQAVANSAGQTPGTKLIRNSKLMAASAFDAVTDWSSHITNGEIAWRYE